MKVLLIIRSIAFGGGAESLVYETYQKLKVLLGADNVKLLVFQNSKIFNYPKYNKYQNELASDVNFIVCNTKLSFKILGEKKLNSNELQSFINDFKPDIIHSHLYLAELYSRSIYYPNAKWITHFHDNMIQFENFSVKTIFKKSRITNFFEKRYLFKRYSVNGGNHFIAISKDTYEFANKTCKNHEISILNNAIDINKFKRNTPIPFDKIRIINVGSFVKKKNQILFIKIAKILREKKIDFIITLVGYGPMLEDLRKLITKNNLDDFFQLTGMVENVNDYLNDSNIYIHSALYEPFGLVLLEAMACSLPVITLNGKGNRDFIEDGKNGFVIETESAELFVEKVVELWLNRNEYLFMSNYAKSFSKTYDINNYVEKLLDIYKKLLSSSKNSNRNFNKI